MVSASALEDFSRSQGRWYQGSPRRASSVAAREAPPAAAAAAASAMEDFSRNQGRWYHGSPRRASSVAAREAPPAAVAAASAMEDFSRSQGQWYHSFPPRAGSSAAAAAPREHPRTAAAATAASPGRPAPHAAGDASPVRAAPAAAPGKAAETVATQQDAVGKLGQASATPAGRFREGDAVCVFSRSTGVWLRDGIVVQVLSEPAEDAEDAPGVALPAGSAKVLYGEGGFAKWVPPDAFGAELRRADFTVGDAVCVRCRSLGRWVMDGIVVGMLPEGGGGTVVEGGLTMPAGSVKVTYARGAKSRWIPPASFGIELASQRRWDVFREAEGCAWPEGEEEKEEDEGGAKERQVEEGEDEEEEEECSTTASVGGESTPSPETPEPAVPPPDSCQRFGAAPLGQSQPMAFRVGDPVCVFRRGAGEWSRDGVVARALAEPAVVDGVPMPAGAVKVIYDGGEYAKWVPPSVFGMEVKPADFMVGDAVSVLCRSMGLWVADGAVVEALSEDAVVEGGLTLPAGAVKVTYANGAMAKWIPPQAFGAELRAQRPPCDGGEGGVLSQPGAADAARAGPAACEASEEARGLSLAAQMAGSFMAATVGLLRA